MASGEHEVTGTGDDVKVERVDEMGARKRLKAWISYQFAKAFVATSDLFRSCQHTDDSKYTIVNGKTVHCACGTSFTIKCLHIRIAKLLPRVFQCVDCKEVRGAGEVDYDALNANG